MIYSSLVDSFNTASLRKNWSGLLYQVFLMPILHINLKTRVSFDRVHMPWCRFPKQNQIFLSMQCISSCCANKKSLISPSQKDSVEEEKRPQIAPKLFLRARGFAETNVCSHSSTTMNCVCLWLLATCLSP